MPFPIGAASPLAYPGPPPGAADVVVIGGGVIGVTSALFLARRGLSVVLVEKGRVAGEQSSRNWGWIRQQGRDPDELPVMIEARRIWQALAADCGEDIGLVQGGVTYLARTRRALADLEGWMVHARAHELDTRLLDRAATARLIPGMARPYLGALTTPSDMRAEPWCAVLALARLAAREGVRIVENCAARCLDLAAGRIAGVVTEAGRIGASAVVLAGGAWSGLFLRAHGVALPQLSVRSTVAATGPLRAVCRGGVSDGRVAFRPRSDGGYTIAAAGRELYLGPDAFRAAPKFVRAVAADPFGTGLLPAAPKGYPDAWGTPRAWTAEEETPFERMRILDPTPNRAAVARMVRAFGALVPGIGEVKLAAVWAGMIDTMPDVVPVIDRCAEIPGLTIGTGMCGHGFGIGPGVGRVLAALTAGDDPGHALGRFRLGRFSDGSRLRLGQAL